MIAVTLLQVGIVLAGFAVASGVLTLLGLVLTATASREDTETYVPREWCDDGDTSSVRHKGLGR